MRIPCPFCGARDLTEFSYLGDAAGMRPVLSGEGAQSRFVESIYFRDNPAGLHVEMWYHAFGCHSWLRVTRDTRTHEVSAVQFATPDAAP